MRAAGRPPGVNVATHHSSLITHYSSLTKADEASMSFRSFIIYCTLCAGWAAFLGWGLGRLVLDEKAPGAVIQSTGIKAMFLGMLVALALVLVDALSDLSLRQLPRAVPRVLAGLFIGTIGGLAGG